MGDTKLPFEEGCEYSYHPNMTIELNFAEKQRNVSPDFVDRMLLSEDVSYTDYFLLRAVVFFRFATAEMVAEYILYFRNFYGSDVNKLLMPNVQNNEIDVFLQEEKFDRKEDMIRYRLNRLARKYLLLSYSVMEKHDGENRLRVVYCCTYMTYSIVRSFFGDHAYFSDKILGYERFYSVMPLYRMMEEMHASRIAVLAFSRHRKKVLLLREKEMVYGSTKSRIHPVMTAKVEYPDKSYKILIEPVHYSFDERIVTKPEHEEQILAHIEEYYQLINHYRYMKKKFDGQNTERIRFLIATENLEGMKKIVRIMNNHMEKFNEKVFFTTDYAVKNAGSLKESVLMAKVVKSRVSDEMHLGLVRPTEESLLASNNDWVIG